MLTCQIQWINSNGEPTPDANPAVGFAQFHKPIHAYLTGKVIEYSSEIQDSFLICENHRKQMTDDMMFPRGGWQFIPLPESDGRAD